MLCPSLTGAVERGINRFWSTFRRPGVMSLYSRNLLHSYEFRRAPVATIIRHLGICLQPVNRPFKQRRIDAYEKSQDALFLRQINRQDHAVSRTSGIVWILDQRLASHSILLGYCTASLLLQGLETGPSGSRARQFRADNLRSAGPGYGSTATLCVTEPVKMFLPT